MIFFKNVGDDSDTTTLECCGDDSAEEVRYRNCWYDVCVTSTADRACCTSVTDCVYNSQCYADNALADIDSDGEVEACVDGHWEAEVCLSDGDNSCDQDSDCCSDHCIPAIYNYYDSYSSSLNYVCAPDTTYCGSSIAPFYFASGTVYDSPLAGEDVLLCLDGENYRCFMPSDWCNLGQGVRSTTDDLNGYKCMCATEVIGSCAWRKQKIIDPMPFFCNFNCGSIQK